MNLDSGLWVSAGGASEKLERAKEWERLTGIPMERLLLYRKDGRAA